jgi:hypothetical protein
MNGTAMARGEMGIQGSIGRACENLSGGVVFARARAATYL